MIANLFTRNAAWSVEMVIPPEDMSVVELQQVYVAERKLCDELATFVLQNKEAVHPEQRKHAEQVLSRYVEFRSLEAK